MKRVASLLFFFTLSLWSGVQDHIKHVENDGLDHSFGGIDFVYIINLDERPDKYEKTMEALLPWGIHPQRFSAVNGWKLPLDTLNDVGVIFDYRMQHGIMGSYYIDDYPKPMIDEMIHMNGKSYFSHRMSRGAIGICLSHLSILQDAWDRGYKTIWVLEDDVEVVRDPTLLSSMIHELDSKVGREKWDILFTDRDTRNTLTGQYIPCRSAAKRPNFDVGRPKRYKADKQITPNIRRVGARYGAYSMIINRNGMRKLLDFFYTYKIFLPYDMDFCVPKDIRLYTVTSDVVTFKTGSASDNGKPHYAHDR